MRAFRKSTPTLTAKERTERKRNATVYHTLKNTPTNSRTYQITSTNHVLSANYQARYQLIKGREHYLQEHGTPTQLDRVYGKKIVNNQRFTPETVQDYQYRKFNADIASIPDYPGNDALSDNSQNYIYNLPYHMYYDNANDENNKIPNPGEMTSDIYNTYLYFNKYPYRIDTSGNMDYANFISGSTIDRQFVVSDVSETIYRNPKSLIRQPLQLDT